MALKSEQAQVLRRRVIGGLLRNLVLFSGAFALACVTFQAFIVPPLADYVADSTSSWRTLNSSEQFRQKLADQGFLGEGNPFPWTVTEFVEMGYPAEAGSIQEVQGEVDAMEAAIAEFAATGTVPEEEDAAKDRAAKEAENAGVSGNVSAAAGVDAEVVADGEKEWVDDSTNKSATPKPAPVSLVGYTAILAAEDIEAAEASAAEAMAALRASSSIQELSLALATPSPLLPPETDQDTVTQILASTALMGYDQTALDDILREAYRTSQEQAYEAWLNLPVADEARALGLADDHPVWQIEQNADGVYAIRDVATYTFVKSFKLPLAALVFVAGWLIIIFRSLNKSLRYFDDLSGAVGKLLADKNAPIELPADLSIARNELAVMRSQSLADERAAKAAEQRKNELVAYLAHDIRTPLTSVLGYLDLLRETTDLPRDTLRKYADIAYTKAERLESLINEFFEITRYNLSAIPIERETIGVRLFCQQVAEAFFPEASARNIRISIDVAAPDQFFVDPDKLARALGNVLRNAVAYADPNSVIALAARQDARLTTITVANRGREISQAHLESIFEKFYREDGARTTRSGGAGLGLAIAREIVVAHHGDIEAASERGVTVFTLRIPTHGDDEGAPAPARGERPGPSRDRGAASGPLPAPAPHPTQRPVPPARGERSAPRRQSAAPLNPRNGHHGSVPARPAVRDNGSRPRRRGLPR